ncbi:MAG: hypothetical protein EZS28_005407 [Streblomastix strix]|uniref:Uncharacterized protein n=1 Tax=Streblomastix strix TaxID=222440 RepID=A0A5J4WXV3_9EUKA|nr:MAG: hypothetical protein EZS28_005407 [Streblomastix strix]
MLPECICVELKRIVQQIAYSNGELVYNVLLQLRNESHKDAAYSIIRFISLGIREQKEQIKDQISEMEDFSEIERNKKNHLTGIAMMDAMIESLKWSGEKQIRRRIDEKKANKGNKSEQEQYDKQEIIKPERNVSSVDSEKGQQFIPSFYSLSVIQALVQIFNLNSLITLFDLHMIMINDKSKQTNQQSQEQEQQDQDELQDDKDDDINVEEESNHIDEDQQEKMKKDEQEEEWIEIEVNENKKVKQKKINIDSETMKDNENEENKLSSSFLIKYIPATTTVLLMQLAVIHGCDENEKHLEMVLSALHCVGNHVGFGRKCSYSQKFNQNNLFSISQRDQIDDLIECDVISQNEEYFPLKAKEVIFGIQNAKNVQNQLEIQKGRSKGKKILQQMMKTDLIKKNTTKSGKYEVGQNQRNIWDAAKQKEYFEHFIYAFGIRECVMCGFLSVKEFIEFGTEMIERNKNRNIDYENERNIEGKEVRKMEMICGATFLSIGAVFLKTYWSSLNGEINHQQQQIIDTLTQNTITSLMICIHDQESRVRLTSLGGIGLISSFIPLFDKKKEKEVEQEKQDKIDLNFEDQQNKDEKHLTQNKSLANILYTLLQLCGQEDDQLVKRGIAKSIRRFIVGLPDKWDEQVNIEIEKDKEEIIKQDENEVKYQLNEQKENQIWIYGEGLILEMIENSDKKNESGFKLIACGLLDAIVSKELRKIKSESIINVDNKLIIQIQDEREFFTMLHHSIIPHLLILLGDQDDNVYQAALLCIYRICRLIGLNEVEKLLQNENEEQINKVGQLKRQQEEKFVQKYKDLARILMSANPARIKQYITKLQQIIVEGTPEGIEKDKTGDKVEKQLYEKIKKRKEEGNAFSGASTGLGMNEMQHPYSNSKRIGVIILGSLVGQIMLESKKEGNIEKDTQLIAETVRVIKTQLSSKDVRVRIAAVRAISNLWNT